MKVRDKQGVVSNPFDIVASPEDVAKVFNQLEAEDEHDEAWHTRFMGALSPHGLLAVEVAIMTTWEMRGLSAEDRLNEMWNTIQRMEGGGIQIIPIESPEQLHEILSQLLGEQKEGGDNNE